jgi:hypothetical protein
MRRRRAAASRRFAPRNAHGALRRHAAGAAREKTHATAVHSTLHRPRALPFIC